MANLNFIVPNWPVPTNVRSLQTTRLDGVSSSPYESLNLAAHVKDDVNAVATNRQLLRKYLPSEPVWLNQVHGIEVIDAEKSTYLHNADASYTKKDKVVCAIMTADCLPLLLCDKSGSEVAAVHAGWRGLCDGVIEAAVNKFSADKIDILAWLGPAIGPNAFEVGDDVLQQFIERDRCAEQAFTNYGDKWLCNIYLLAQQRLNSLGVTKIYGSGFNADFCTYSDKTRFFSFRRENITGRMATMIWLDTSYDS